MDSLLYSVDVTSSYFTTDHLQNLYYINGKNEVIKYAATSEAISELEIFVQNPKKGNNLQFVLVKEQPIFIFFQNYF